MSLASSNLLGYNSILTPQAITQIILVSNPNKGDIYFLYLKRKKIVFFLGNSLT